MMGNGGMMGSGIFNPDLVTKVTLGTKALADCVYRYRCSDYGVLKYFNQIHLLSKREIM